MRILKTISHPMLILSLVLTLPSCAFLSRSRVEIPQDIENKIETSMKNEVMVYTLDIEGENQIFGNIDKWVEKQVNLADAKKLSNKRGDRFTCRVSLSQNKPIFCDKTRTSGIKSKEPFNVFFIKGAQRREFIKEISSPTTNQMEEKEAIRIGTDFISKNKFFLETANDMAVRPVVINQKIKILDESNHDLKDLNQYTRVIFRRSLSGSEVINSRQIVTLHPYSHEVISYKNLHWTPVIEMSGKLMPSLTEKEVLKKIRSHYKNSKHKYLVKEIRPGMFQTATQIIPVLAVTLEQQVKKAENQLPEKEILIISLIRLEQLR